MAVNVEKILTLSHDLVIGTMDGNEVGGSIFWKKGGRGQSCDDILGNLLGNIHITPPLPPLNFRSPTFYSMLEL